MKIVAEVVYTYGVVPAVSGIAQYIKKGGFLFRNRKSRRRSFTNFQGLSFNNRGIHVYSRCMKIVAKVIYTYGVVSAVSGIAHYIQNGGFLFRNWRSERRPFTNLQGLFSNNRGIWVYSLGMKMVAKVIYTYGVVSTVSGIGQYIQNGWFLFRNRRRERRLFTNLQGVSSNNTRIQVYSRCMKIAAEVFEYVLKFFDFLPLQSASP